MIGQKKRADVAATIKTAANKAGTTLIIVGCIACVALLLSVVALSIASSKGSK